MSRYGFGGDQWFDDNGKPLSRGKLKFYEVGTGSPKTTYANVSLTTENTWPVVLDADGRQPDVFFGGAARLVIESAAGVQIDDADPVYPVQSTVSVVVGADAGVSVETWDDLMLIESDTDFSTCTMLGFSAPGDGGGGVFYWDSSSVATPNIGTIVQPTATVGAGRWIRMFDGKQVSIKWFGARGDNATDNSDAINLAFDWLRATTASAGIGAVFTGTVLIPGGVYRVYTTINATGINGKGWNVVSQGGVIKGYMSGTPVVDALGSLAGVWDGLYIYGIGAGGAYPNIGLQMGREGTGARPNNVFNRMIIDGFFTETCLLNYASETCGFYSCYLKNRNNTMDSYCIAQDGTNEFGVTSAYITVTAAVGDPASFNGCTFVNCDFIKDAGGPAMFNSFSNMHRYIGCYGVSIDDCVFKNFTRDGNYTRSLELDMHFEAADIAPGLLHCVRFVGPDMNPQIRGLVIRDHSPHPSVGIFDATEVTFVILLDLVVEMQKANATSPPPLLFYPGSKFQAINAKLDVGNSGIYNPPALMNGFISVIDHTTLDFAIGTAHVTDGTGQMRIKGEYIFADNESNSVAAGNLGNTGTTTITGREGIIMAGTNNYLTFSNSRYSASATAGAAPLPATPGGFIQVVINGATVKIPYYPS